MDKGSQSLGLSEGITQKNPVRLNPDKAMAPVLDKLTGKNLLSNGGIIQTYQFIFWELSSGRETKKLLRTRKVP
jgi:hypothetical protein